MVDVEFKAKINAYVDGDGIYNGIDGTTQLLMRVFGSVCVFVLLAE